MKKTKKYLLLIVVILVVALGLIASYSSKTEFKNLSKPPEIFITSNDIDIPYVVGKNIWNGSIYDRLDNFQVIMTDNTEEKLPYIPIGQEIQIVFKDCIPESLELVDEIIENSGNVMFNNSSKAIPINLNNGKGSFIVDNHYATLLSSNLYAFDNGILRGFRLTCKWGDNECEYSFVIKTNK